MSDARGISYFDDQPWQLPGAQLSYGGLAELLGAARIALVSPPNLTDPRRTGAVSPLTHRYLEAAMCFACPLGLAPTGGEYAAAFPGGFTREVGSYEEFAAACEAILAQAAVADGQLVCNREYVARNHSAAARARALRAILDAWTGQQTTGP